MIERLVLVISMGEPMDFGVPIVYGSGNSDDRVLMASVNRMVNFQQN